LGGFEVLENLRRGRDGLDRHPGPILKLWARLPPNSLNQHPHPLHTGAKLSHDAAATGPQPYGSTWVEFWPRVDLPRPALTATHVAATKAGYGRAWREWYCIWLEVLLTSAIDAVSPHQFVFANEITKADWTHGTQGKLLQVEWLRIRSG
jgi:hypothetical protein